MLKLFDYQLDALERMSNGCILAGDVGSGKSLTALGYYYLKCGGSLSFLKGGKYVKMTRPVPLYIITTARKRNLCEWETDMVPFLLSSIKDNNASPYDIPVVIDSWNNIHKYTFVTGAFFIFDEQRLVGKGTWAKSFLKIVRQNKWILLSATPGDKWEDYITIFLAHGYYRNRTEFYNDHVVWSRFTKYPKIEKYLSERRLESYRSQILVPMDYKNDVIIHDETIHCNYDKERYKELIKTRYDFQTDTPIENASQLCMYLRRITNSSDDRQLKLLDIYEKSELGKVIIFYNYDFELEILRHLPYGTDVTVAEYNGHKHEEIPKTNRWVYLVQYKSGSEAWNCIETNTMIFYSNNYSYKQMHQAAGRINRKTTPFKELFYYHLSSYAFIDISIERSIKQERIFTESGFIRSMGIRFDSSPKAVQTKLIK